MDFWTIITSALGIGIAILIAILIAWFIGVFCTLVSYTIADIVRQVTKGDK